MTDPKRYTSRADAQTVADLYGVDVRASKDTPGAQDGDGWVVVILDSTGCVDAVLRVDGRWNGSTRYLNSREG